MTRPYGYDEGYQDGYEAAELKLEAELANLKTLSGKLLVSLDRYIDADDKNRNRRTLGLLWNKDKLAAAVEEKQ